MNKRFNLIKCNAKKLKPKREHVKMNKCTHSIVNNDNVCLVCGWNINTDLNLDEFLRSADVVADYLETMKMIISNTCCTRAERKAAQKYFNMIPLLSNIESLYKISYDKSKLADNNDSEVNTNE